MGLSSDGLKYLLNGLKNIDEKDIILDISGNDIDSEGVEYLMKYMKELYNIEDLIFHSIFILIYIFNIEHN